LENHNMNYKNAACLLRSYKSPFLLQTDKR
jgi:hypothetical protein